MTIEKAHILFKKLLQEDRLSQGYILFGENRVKINAFTENLVDKIVESDSGVGYSSKSSHQAVDFDIKALDGLDSGISKIIEAERFLWERPIASSRKALVILNADYLTREAQNALLKISEEPPQYAVFLLSAFSPELLIDTLASRFQKIYIAEKADIENFLAGMPKDLTKFRIANNKKLLPALLKRVGDDGLFLDKWLGVVVAELLEDIDENWERLKKIFLHMRALKQYNLNMRLQLEVILNIIKE